MSDPTQTDEFTIPDFDGAPPAPHTLTDDQGGGSSGDGERADYSKYEGEVAELSEKTRCRVNFAAPKSWNKDGKGGERIRFNVIEPVELAGLEATLFLTLIGSPSKVAKGRRDLAAFGKSLDCTEKGIPALLDAVTKAAADNVEIDVDLVPARNGGDPFINFV
jgi:hypothetical protein